MKKEKNKEIAKREAIATISYNSSTPPISGISE
jgi:hypothetical protein